MARYKKVLLVDDNEADNFLHQEVIADAEFAEQIYVAYNGREALRLLQTPDEAGEYLSPCVIFLDVNMPLMNGFEFLAEYAALPENIRGGNLVMMLTSSMNPNDEKRAASDAYVAAFMTKPLNEAQLALIH